jgi:A/G-specific adenine glycosylase
MLQQTQVDTVLPYYARFLDRFPTLEALASAPEDQVLSLWSGLGYYARARNLTAAARQIVDDHGGKIPADFDALIALPGIGRYMAGAIMSIAFNQPYPIVDGNVRRVLARLHGWVEPKDSEVWAAAGAMVERAEPRVVNQAMMELGATVCTFRKPDCAVCPCEEGCAAKMLGRQAEIPAPRKRPETVRVELCAIVDHNRNGVLMKEEKGFWQFPMLDDLPEGKFSKVGHCRHAITHHRVEVDVFEGRMPDGNRYCRVRFEGVAVTSLTRKIMRVYEDGVGSATVRPK